MPKRIRQLEIIGHKAPLVNSGGGAEELILWCGLFLSADFVLWLADTLITIYRGPYDRLGDRRLALVIRVKGAAWEETGGVVV